MKLNKNQKFIYNVDYNNGGIGIYYFRVLPYKKTRLALQPDNIRLYYNKIVQASRLIILENLIITTYARFYDTK